MQGKKSRLRTIPASPTGYAALLNSLKLASVQFALRLASLFLSSWFPASLVVMGGPGLSVSAGFETIIYG
jgi:hypothetical protein